MDYSRKWFRTVISIVWQRGGVLVRTIVLLEGSRYKTLVRSIDKTLETRVVLGFLRLIHPFIITYSEFLFLTHTDYANLWFELPNYTHPKSKKQCFNHSRIVPGNCRECTFSFKLSQKLEFFTVIFGATDSLYQPNVGVFYCNYRCWIWI